MCPQSESESIFVCLPLNNSSKVLIAGTYKPPGQPTAVYVDFVAALEEVILSQVFHSLFVG